MKTKSAVILILFIILVFSGCIPSLHPLYKDSDRIELDEIVGLWYSDDGDELYEFEKDDDEPYYILAYTELQNQNNTVRDSTTARLITNIVKLGEHYFMDFYPADNDVLDNMNGMLQLHLLGVHTFAKLIINDGKIEIHRFNTSWLDELFEQNKIRIPHEKVDDQIVLTASTDELQKFVIKYANDKGAFNEPEIISKIKP